MEGKEISKFRSDLIARYAKAWDSTKSPSILKSSIFTILFLILFSNLSNKYLFFLPPPQTIIFLEVILFAIISIVYSTIVAAPSSTVNPLNLEISKQLGDGRLLSQLLKKKISKSLTSKDFSKLDCPVKLSKA